MNKNFTALPLLISFTLPVLEEYLIPYLKYAQLIEYDSPLGPSDPPSGYVFNSLGTVSASAITQTSLVMPYSVQYVEYPSPQELQTVELVNTLIPTVSRKNAAGC